MALAKSDAVDRLFLHQANYFMNYKIAKKLRFSSDCVVLSWGVATASLRDMHTPAVVEVG